MKKTNQSEKLRALADAMEKTIEGKLNSGVSQQRPTARRSRLAAGMREDAYNLQLVQSCLRGLANLLEKTFSPNVPKQLYMITTKAQVESLLNGCYWPDFKPGFFPSRDEAKVATLAKISVFPGNFLECQKALLALKDSNNNAEALAKENLKQLEAKLLGRKIPGFFPTPVEVIEKMCNKLDSTPGFNKHHYFLEPSAGKADIADFLKEKGCKVDCVELNYSLREVLEAKGHKVVGHDFLTDYLPENFYHYILMNPPWGKKVEGHVSEHIKKAYQLLVPGGAMVSLCDAGVFFRNFKADFEFREWLEEVDAEVEALPQGSFKNGFVSTGTNVSMIAIAKPTQTEIKEEVKTMDNPKIAPLSIRDIPVLENNPEIVSCYYPPINKNDWIETYRDEDYQGEKKPKLFKQNAVIERVVELSNADYDKFTHSLLTAQDWIAGNGGTDSTSQVLKIAEDSAAPAEKINAWAKLTEEQKDHWRCWSYSLSTLVYAAHYEPILVNPEGFSYARYVGFIAPETAAKYISQETFEVVNNQEILDQETLDILADCDRLSVSIAEKLKSLSQRT